jgi:alkylhydroperoxidase family enzyme
VTLWTFLDRAAGAIGAVHTAAAALPRPLGLVAYARMRRSGADLPPRLRLLLGQLAAERSGCDWCAQRNRHLALQAGVSAVDVDGVTRYVTNSGYSEPERAALALADAITQFREADNGFPPEVLCRARHHFDESEIMAIVGVVAAEHFFDARTGRMGRDAEEGTADVGSRR